MEVSFTDKISIGVFGDSISKGIVLQDESERYVVMKGGLNEFLQSKNINIDIDNFSMMGCTIAKGLSVIKRRAGELARYRNVFLEFGGNDCDYLWQEVAENPEKAHEPKTPVSDFVRLYTQAIEEIRSHGGNPIILTLPPLDPVRYFNWISKRLNKDSIMKWIGSVDTIYRWQEMYNMQSIMLAAKLAVPLIDIRSVFLADHNYKRLLCEDGIHPNRDGYELIYKTIAEGYEIGM